MMTCLFFRIATYIRAYLAVHLRPVVPLTQLRKCLVSSEMSSVMGCFDKPQLLFFTLNDQSGLLLYFSTNIVKKPSIHSEICSSFAQRTFRSFCGLNWIHPWSKVVCYVHKRMGALRICCHDLLSVYVCKIMWTMDGEVQRWWSAIRWLRTLEKFSGDGYLSALAVLLLREFQRWLFGCVGWLALEKFSGDGRLGWLSCTGEVRRWWSAVLLWRSSSVVVGSRSCSGDVRRWWSMVGCLFCSGEVRRLWSAVLLWRSSSVMIWSMVGWVCCPALEKIGDGWRLESSEGTFDIVC